jgi:hypothetical protein
MSKRTSILPAILLASAALAAATPQPVTLVICAPGYPGSTKEAQPSMDVLAKAVTAAVGSPARLVAAEYYETEEAGVARMKAKTPSLALVPLPFYLSHAGELKLQAKAQAVEKDGQAAVSWTLVAKKGSVSSPADLSGFTLVSIAGYAPDFIKNVALAKWGALPADVTIQANGQVLSSLRKAASGEKVAVLLDAAQASSLPTLPFASDIAIVATSPPIPGIVVCTVGTTVKPADANGVLGALLNVHKTPEGRAALDGVRLAKFVPPDTKAIAAARVSYGSAASTKTR